MASKKLKTVEPIPVSQPRHELLLVADTVAREKGIERDEVLSAMEQAIQKAARAKYGLEHDIQATVDKTTGDVTIFKCMTVVEIVENSLTEISLEDAKSQDDSAALGDVLSETLPPIEFGRVAAQSARQVIFQKVRDAERAHQYAEFKNRIDEIVSALVKRIEFGLEN